MNRRTLLIAVTIALTLSIGCVGLVTASTSAGGPAADPPPPDTANVSAPIDSALLETESGISTQQHATPENEGVHVEVLAETAGQAAPALVSQYGRVTADRGRRLEAVVPRSNLTDLANESAIEYVQRPRYLESATTTEGVDRTNADIAHVQGATGANSTVAVIDISIDPAHAPIQDAVVETKNFKSSGAMDDGSTKHGDAVAEITHEMAPDADLVLVTAATILELEDAAEWVNAHDEIDVVVMSLGTSSERLDGKAPIDTIIDDGVEGGTNWVVSAGNEGDGNHYYGAYRNADGDQYHEFDTASSESECNLFTPRRSDTRVTLQWDAWESTDERYGLALYEMQDDGSLALVDSSNRDQTRGADPVEIVSGYLDTSQRHCVAITDSGGSGDATFSLFASSHVDFRYSDTSRSMVVPATAAGSVAVGASHWDRNGLRAYSSRGPTVDGRTGIDLVGPDGVSTTAYEPNTFPGTSAAAPHVAGAAAILAGQNTTASAMDINDRLRETAGAVGGTTTEATAIGAGHLMAARAAAPQSPTVTDPPAVINRSNQVSVDVAVAFERPPVTGTVEVRASDGESTILAASPADTSNRTTTVTVDTSPLMDGEVTVEARLVDGAWANVGGFTAQTTVRKDTVRPSVSNVTIPAAPINETNTETAQPLHLTFDEPMATDTAPAVSVTGLEHSPTVTATDGWTNETTWVGGIEFEDRDEEAMATVDVTEAADAAGNTIQSTSGHTISVDTRAPAVSRLNATATEYQIDLTLEADEPLANATIHLDGPDARTLTLADFEETSDSSPETYTLTQSVTAEGEYTVSVPHVVDAVGNDAAPSVAATAIVEPPEFNVTALNATSTVVQGDQYVVNATVTNVGGETGADTVALTVGDGSPVDTTSVDLGAGASTTVTFVDTIPSDQPPGETPLTVSTGDDSNETTMTVLESARFSVSSFSAPSTVEQGAPIPVETTIQNTGDVTGTDDVELRLGSDLSAADEATLVAAVSDLELAAGASETVELNGTIPVDTDTGEYDLGVVTAADRSIRSVHVEAATGSLEGRVVAADDTTRGLNATMTLTDAETERTEATLVTDSDGTFARRDLPVGTYNVQVTAADYQPANGTIVVDRNTTTTREFGLVPEPASITGTLTDVDTGDSLDGTVTFSDMDSETNVTVQARNGTYQAAVPRGTYVVAATEIDAAYEPTTVGERTYSAAENASLSISLAPKPGSITGRVVAADSGAPIDNATVRVDDQTHDTDAEGRFNFTTVARGEYNIEITAPAFETGTLEDVTIEPNQTVDLAAVELNPTPATVAGTVTNVSSGTPIGDADLVFVPESGEHDAKATTADTDGQYTITLPRGSYDVAVRARGYTETITSISLAANETVTKDLGVEPAERYVGIVDLAIDGPVTAGDVVTAAVTVGNFGQGNTTDTIELRFDGSVVDMETVALQRGANMTLHLAHPTNDGLAAGDYAITVRTSNETVRDVIAIEAPEDDSGGSGRRGGGGGGGSAAPAPAPAPRDGTGDVRNESAVENQTTSTHLVVERVAIEETHRTDDGVTVPFDTVMVEWVALRNASATGTVTVTDGVDVSATSDPGGTVLSTFRIEPPGGNQETNASIAIAVPNEAVGNATAITIEHYDERAATWRPRETRVVETRPGSTLVVANVTGFSLFAVTESTQQPSDETQSKATVTPTPTTGSTPSSTPTTSRSAPGTSSEDDGAGFGALLAILAIFAYSSRRRVS